MILTLLLGMIMLAAPSVAEEDEDEKLIAAGGRPSGCNQDAAWGKRLQTWGETVGYSNAFGDDFVIRLSVTTMYYKCDHPNVNIGQQVKPKKIEFCYSHLDSSDGGLGFGGVDFDTFYVSDSANIDPGTVFVADDGTVQNCKLWDIPAANEAWMHPMCSAEVPCARWKVTAWIRVVGMPGKEVVFKAINGQGELRDHKFFSSSWDTPSW